MNTKEMEAKYWNSRQLHHDVAAGFTSIHRLPGSVESTRHILLPQQTHTTNVAWVCDDNLPAIIENSPCDAFPDTDALITSLRGVTIGVRTADCVPILLYAADIKAVAAVHAGWKGSLHGIVDVTISELIDHGANPLKIHACFGPSICSECYEVDETLAQIFSDAGFGDCVSSAPVIDPLESKFFPENKPHLNLIKVNINRLISNGIQACNINPQSFCTRHFACSDGVVVNQLYYPFHSWRRTPSTPHRIITAITIL